MPEITSNEQAQKYLEDLINCFFNGFTPEILTTLIKTPYETVRKRIVSYIDSLYSNSNPNTFSELDNLPGLDSLKNSKMAPYLIERKYQEQREEFMASAIRKANPDLHIGGIAHMFSGYYLYLSDYLMTADKK